MIVLWYSNYPNNVRNKNHTFSIFFFLQNSIDAHDNNTLPNSQLSSKHSTLSVGTSSTTMSSKQQPSSSILNPLLKIEGQSKFWIENRGEKKNDLLG
jgi:hypothetical protein